MACKTFICVLLLALLSGFRTSFANSVSAPTYPDPSPCPHPTRFANTLIRAPTPSAPKLAVKDEFLQEQILFYYTDQNIFLSEAAFASFCLDQCISYQPDPKGTGLFPPPAVLPPYYVTNKTGPCLSYTVDMGKPYPPNPKDTAERWYCEGFGKWFAEDLSDFSPNDSPDSYMHGLAVNRDCGAGYRMF